MRSIVFGALIGCAAPLNAQVPTSGALSAAEGQIGRTVRITTGAERRLTGSLQRIQGETLFVAGPNNSLESISAARVSRLEVREPLSLHVRHERGLIGGGVGILLGVAAGDAIAVHRVRGTQHQGGPFEQIDYIFDPAVGVLIGGILGFNIGDHWQSARWTVRFP